MCVVTRRVFFLSVSWLWFVPVVSFAVDGGNFRRGDVNSDGQVNLSDAVSLLGALFLGGEEPSCKDASDANDDGSLDISDSLFTLIHLFSGGSAPPLPGFACGIDPTSDGLDCRSYEPCEILDGRSEFLTPLAGGPGQPARSGELDFAGATPPGAVDANGNQPASAPARLIEESDIYKVSGSLLFVMNRYRGLQVLDLSDLDHPTLIGRAQIFGYPKEMYVRGNTAYVVVSDYYTFWREETDAIASVRGFYGSQLRIIDISNPRDPRVVGGIDLQGDVSDSRIVGDVMYLVSHRYPWYSVNGSTDTEDKTQILSVQVADPMDVRVIDSKDFPRNGWEHHISVTSSAIYLASSGWIWDGVRGNFESRVRYVDISDPQGEIGVRGEALVPGRIQDRWSMDEHEGVLRVASGQSWGNGDVFLTTYSVADPDRIRKIGQAVLHVNENLTAARFDGPRGYLVSYRNIDPLFTFDLSDPSRPRLMGELVMSGWLDFIVPLGDRLVALGHEDSVSPQGTREIRLAVSLIDVSKSTAPTLLSRVVLDGLWGWIPSSRDDFAKVFRTLPSEGLILFPYQAWSPKDYSYVGGVQLIDFDSTRLTMRGLIRDAGWVERAIPQDPGTVITLASDVLQVINIEDRDRPRVRSRLELARNVQGFALLPGNYAVQLSGDWWRGDMHLTVTTQDDPDAVEVVSQVHLPAPYGRLFVNGSMAYVSSVEDDPAAPVDAPRRVTRIRVVDLSDPFHPRERGSVTLPEEVWAGYGRWYWGWGDEAVQLNGSTLVFHRYPFQYWWGGCLDCDSLKAFNPPSTEHKLYFVDLEDADAPRLASTQTISEVEWAWGLKVAGSTLYLSLYNAVFEGEQWFAKYALVRFESSDPANPVRLPDVNIPGMFLDATVDGRVVYTLETWWDYPAQESRTLFHVLAIEGDKAYLRSSVKLGGYSTGVQVEGATAVVFAQGWLSKPLEGVGVQWYSHNELITIDLSDLGNARVASTLPVAIDYGYLEKLQGGRAFVGSGAGILTFDVSDVANPTFERFFRTQGWAQDIIVDDNRVFVPSGWYGVQSFSF